MYLSRGAAQRIVEHLAANLDLQIWVVDQSSKVLASTQSVGAGVPPFSSEASGTQVKAKEGYLYLPLHHADELIGTLIIANAPGQGEEIAHVAQVMAELIIRQTADVEQLIDQQWALNRFVYDLLFAHFRDRPEVVMLQEAKLLSIDLTIPRVVAVVQVASLLDHLQRKTPYPTPDVNGYRRQRHQLRRHLLRQTREIMSANEANLYSFLDEQQLIVLAAIDPTVGATWRQEAQGAIQGFVDEIKRTTNISLAAGLGDYYAGWQTLPSSYHDAQLALEAGQALYGSGQVFMVADLGLAAFVCANNPTTRSRLATQLLRPLFDDPELLETLDVFLQANLSPSLAAQQLHMHRHTLTYRLGKITELTGLNPQEFSAAAQFYAALLWHKLAHTAP